jgi:uncharacterized protein
MESVYAALLALQELDDEIVRAETKLAGFDPQLREAEAPLTALTGEVETMRTRLAELRREAQRLERGSIQKRERLKTFEERLTRVRSSREEAAARTELDLVRRAVDAEEQDALEQMEQATRTDLKLDDMLKLLEKRRAEVEPRIAELQAERSGGEAEIAQLRERREAHAATVPVPTLRLYDRIRQGATKRALAPLTDEGACGHCYNVLPVQEQQQVRTAHSLNRCEACGVILYAL